MENNENIPNPENKITLTINYKNCTLLKLQN